MWHFLHVLWTFRSPKAFTMKFVEVEVFHVMRLNTKNHRCNNDPRYSVVRCMESFVQSEAGCASPWDIFPNEVN